MYAQLIVVRLHAAQLSASLWKGLLVFAEILISIWHKFSFDLRNKSEF